MPSWDFPRSPIGARLFAEVGMEEGLEADQVLAGTGLALTDLRDQSMLIEAGQELQVARNLVGGLGDAAGAGVRAGSRLTVGAMGIWAFAVLTSPTWGDAIGVALRFARLTSTFLRPELEIGGPTPELSLRLHDDELPPEVTELVVERDLAAIVTLIPAFAGVMPPVTIETSLRGRGAEALERVIVPEARLKTGQARHRLTGDPALLATPLPQADEDTWRACRRECEELLDRRSQRTGVAGRVRARLLARPESMPDMTRVAEELHVEVRTLRRHLQAEGTSFRALRDEVRETLAAELLRTAGLSVGEVADRLGFSDAASFTHAFTRWKGVAPGEYGRT